MSKEVILNLDHIEKILEDLSKKRPIFHSEADFQHSLAWKIHKEFPKSEVRLEKRFAIDVLGKDHIYVDIFIKIKELNVAIETKYTTKEFEIKENDEEFRLKNHSALDIRRYDFILDIYRLEALKKHFKKESFIGYAIFLTNTSGYWTESKKKNTNDKDFRIHHNREIKNTLKWAEKTGEGTKKGRESPLRLKNTYKMEWSNYSKIKNEEFKCLLVTV